jgi:hypothetical protein
MVSGRMAIEAARAGRCPRCGAHGLVAGPWGGESRNVYCSICHAGWNLQGVRFGILLVDSIGEVDDEQIMHAEKTYLQPFKLEAEPITDQVGMVMDDTILGVWFCALPDNQDYMATLNRKIGGGFKLTYRFRYYRDSRAFGSDDTKHWYNVTIDRYLPEEAIAIVSGITATLTEAAGPKAERWEILRGTLTLDEFMDKFMKLPFVHVREGDVKPDKNSRWGKKRPIRGFHR